MVNAQDAASPRAIVDRLREERCLSADGRLSRWPDWLDSGDLFAVVDAGLLTRKHYGPATFGHTEYFAE